MSVQSRSTDVSANALETISACERAKAVATFLLAANPKVAWKPWKPWKPCSQGIHLPRCSSVCATWMPVASRSASPLAQAASRRDLLYGAGVALALSFGTPAVAKVVANNEVIFKPPAGSLVGSTVFITGANTGLGLETAKRLAAAGACVILAARSKAKADAAAQAVAVSTDAGNAIPIELDLANLSSVKSLPGRLQAQLGKFPTIDVLVNNAGVMAIPKRLTTFDGFEKTMGINHLGHFALLGALLPNLRAAKQGFRVVTVSSNSFETVDKQRMMQAIEANLDPAKYTDVGWGAYGLSKAANVLFTAELERRLKAAGVKGSAVTLHPGATQTDLSRYLLAGVNGGDFHPTGGFDGDVGRLELDIFSIERGANAEVYLASASDTNGDLSRRGALFFNSKMKPEEVGGVVTDTEIAKKLWDVSEQLTRTKIQL